MDCDPSLMSDLYGMFGLKFEPAYKINSSIAMLSRLRVAVLEGKVRVHPDAPILSSSHGQAFSILSRSIICGPRAPGISI